MIGLEVEIKFSSFFPVIYDEFLRDRTYEQLTRDEQSEMTIATTMQEHRLGIPALLAKGLDCGLGRGKDRYWEHVIPPTTEPLVLIDILNTMHANNLIPPGKHALHMTVGSLRKDRTLYFGLLALELLMSDTARILSGFHKNEPIVKASGWSKKGQAGIFFKTDWELKHEAEAVELRTLQLNPSDLHIEAAFKIMRAVAGMQANNADEIGCRELMEFMSASSNVLERHGLEDKNWLKPFQNPVTWTKFAHLLPKLRIELNDELRGLQEC